MILDGGFNEYLFSPQNLGLYDLIWLGHFCNIDWSPGEFETFHQNHFQPQNHADTVFCTQKDSKHLGSTPSKIEYNFSVFFFQLLELMIHVNSCIRIFSFNLQTSRKFESWGATTPQISEAAERLDPFRHGWMRRFEGRFREVSLAGSVNTSSQLNVGRNLMDQKLISVYYRQPLFGEVKSSLGAYPGLSKTSYLACKNR